MQFHDRIEETLDLFWFGVHVHQEIVHAPEEGSPLEEVAATDEHQRLVGGSAELQGLAAQVGPEILLGRMIPGTVREGGPVDPGHVRAQT